MMTNKADILMHPVRIKICQAIMRNKENGLTPLEMVKMIEDVPQATLYRHIQVLLDADIIRILKEKKVRSVSEKYYTLNLDEMRLSSEEWSKASPTKKINYYSYYQLTLMNQYQNYLNQLADTDALDRSTISLLELKLDDERFDRFQSELNELMLKYYHEMDQSAQNNVPHRTVGITIIPDA